MGNVSDLLKLNPPGIKPADETDSNQALVQGLYSAFGRGAVGEILPFLDENVVWGEPANPFNPSAGTHYGHAGFLQWLDIGKKAEDILVLEPQRLLAQGDMVAVVGHSKCLARFTGRIYESDFVHLVTIKRGKIVRFQEFFDTFAAAEAFRA